MIDTHTFNLWSSTSKPYDLIFKPTSLLMEDKTCFTSHCSDYVMPIFIPVQWLPLHSCIQHKPLDLTAKAIHGLAPPHPSSLICHHGLACGLQLSSNTTLYCSKVPCCLRWLHPFWLALNCLLPFVCNVDLCSSFKSHLKHISSMKPLVMWM